MRHWFVFILLFVIITCFNLPSAYAAPEKGDSANLRRLNKITGEVSDVTVRVGGENIFGKLRINLFACYITIGVEGRDDQAFLQIWDASRFLNKKKEAEAEADITRNSVGERRIFSGWMFSADPALNPLDHAVYDVWLLRCNK